MRVQTPALVNRLDDRPTWLRAIIGAVEITAIFVVTFLLHVVGLV